jgi:hypothetical protein
VAVELLSNLGTDLETARADARPQRGAPGLVPAGGHLGTETFDHPSDRSTPACVSHPDRPR